jgi:hypothetical protein
MEDESIVTHEIQGFPWHASQALIKQYTTVLHLHELELSGPSGPVYEFPECRAVIEKPRQVDKIDYKVQ